MTAPALRRSLGTRDLALLVAGIIVGAGIFSTPGTVAQFVSQPVWILFAWGLGGLIALSGALVLAELGSTFPDAGGDYTYLHRCFGPFPAFLFGWLFFTVSGTGSIAALGVASGEYARDIVPALPGAVVGVVIIVALTVVNAVGLRAGATTQNVLTAVKFAVMAGVIALAFLGGGSGEEAVASAATAGEGIPPGGVPLGGLSIALVPICFTYMGWSSAGYVGGEVRDPARTFPRGLLIGTALVAALYLVINGAFLVALTPQQMAGDVLVATTACQGILGERASRLVSAAVLISIVGCLNGMVLTHGRVLYAMAREGHLFRIFARIHPRTATPVAALALQGVWAVGLMFTGDFRRVVSYVTFVMISLAVLVVVGLFVARRRGLATAFRMPGYPWIPLFFIGVSGWILVGVVRYAPMDAAIGVGMAVVGAVVYGVWRALTPRRP
jgi:basic amino acid/polyamine antiporter, APA family